MAREELALLGALLVANVALAQSQRPLPANTPDALPQLARVHVLVRDSLDPDRLRSLARHNVTAWVETSSNTLSAAAVEHLARFDEAFVQLRAPVRPVDAREFAKMPRVGAWLRVDQLELAGALPGVRRLAVSTTTMTEETLARLRRARPAFVSWAPQAEVDLLQWSIFHQLPGRKVVVAGTQVLLPVRCEGRSGREPAVELHVANLLALSSDVFPCGRGTRVIVPVDAERWLVQSLLARDPSVELVLEIGADADRASKASRLLELLGLGASR